MRANLLLATVLLLGACAEAPAPPEPGPDRLDEALSQGVQIHAYEGGTLEVTGRLTAPGEVDRVGRVSLSIVDASGWVQFDPDGVLWLEDLDVTLDDVVVQLYRTPVHLTDLRLALVEPTGAFPGYSDVDTGRIEMRAPVTLELTWAVREPDGRVRPLAPARITALPMQASFELNPIGLFVGHVSLSSSGEVWSWRGVLHLENPEIRFDVTDHERSHPVD